MAEQLGPSARQAGLEYFTKRLAQFCSVDSPTGDRAAADSASRLLAQWAAELGCEVEGFATPAGDHLRATLNGGGSGRVLLVGHHDTVWARGTAAARPLRIDGPRAMGPGAADMKGGLILGLMVLRRLAAGDRAGFSAVELHSLPDEEARVGAPARMDLFAGADAAIVLECGRERGAFVSSRNAATWVTMQARGRGAHAGQDAARGRSALHALIAEVARIERLHAARDGLSVVATTLVSDGAPNAIPSCANATFDVRAPSMATLEWAMEQVAAVDRHDGVDFTSTRDTSFPPLERSEALVALTRRVLDNPTDEHAGGASDGCWTSSLGIPTVDGLGPIGGDDHTEHEWIDLRSVEPRVQAVAGLCEAASIVTSERSEDGED